MLDFGLKFYQIAIFGQLCFDGKNFRVQALERVNEIGSGESS